ncbi:unnamed protein product, partial [Allacma fusca]
MAGDETVEVSNKLPLWFST